MKMTLLLLGNNSLLLLFLLGFASLTSRIVVAEQAFEVGKAPTTPVHLTQANFRTAIEDPANAFWFLKFYAPWCGHCKRMAPVLEKVAGPLKGQMAIGKIDCTAGDAKPVCNEFGVRGYPTLKFALDGAVHDYPGGRDEAAILKFAKKMTRPAVDLVSTVQQAYEHAAEVAEDGVFFVVYHPAVAAAKEALTAEEKLLAGGTLTQLFASVARNTKAFGTFVLLDALPDTHPAEELGVDGATKTSSSDEPEPFLCRLEPNVKPRCLENTQQVDLDTLEEFVKAHNVPTVTKLGPKNFHKLGNSGRPLVIGVVVDEKDAEQVDSMQKSLVDFAVDGQPRELREKYYYGWFDGKKWARFLEQFDVVPAEMPQIFVLDVPTKKYWQDASYKYNVKALLQAVEDGSIGHKFGGKKGVQGWIKRKILVPIVEYAPWSVAALVLALVALFVFIAMNLSPGEDLRPPYPRQEQPDTTTTDQKGGDEDAAKGEEKESETKKDK